MRALKGLFIEDDDKSHSETYPCDNSSDLANDLVSYTNYYPDIKLFQTPNMGRTSHDSPEINITFNKSDDYKTNFEVGCTCGHVQGYINSLENA